MAGKLIIPMITPFKNNHLDKECLQAFLDYAKSNGFDGLFAASSTGGYASLSFEQHQEFLKWVIEMNPGMELYAGITRGSLVESIHIGTIADDLGYGKLVAINPFYHKYSQQSIIRFYDSILDAFDLDVYAYNNPPLSGNEIAPETIAAIREQHDNLVGLKDSGNNMDKFQEFLKIPKLEVFQGKDALLHESMKMGAYGGVCSSANYCLNTLRIAKGVPDSPEISEKTSRLLKLVSKYETPGIQNYLFRTRILGQKNPKDYVNQPFGDIIEPPSEDEISGLLVLP